MKKPREVIERRCGVYALRRKAERVGAVEAREGRYRARAEAEYWEAKFAGLLGAIRGAALPASLSALGVPPRRPGPSAAHCRPLSSTRVAPAGIEAMKFEVSS